MVSTRLTAAALLLFALLTATMEPPPRGFVTLAEASRTLNKPLGVIGRVTDFMEPKLTKSGEWTLIFTLEDTSNTNLSIRFFKTDARQNELPTIKSVGDYVVLRNIQVKSNKYGLNGLSNWNTKTVCFEAAAIPVPQFKHSVEGGQNLAHIAANGTVAPEAPEQLYIIALHAALSAAPSAAGSGLDSSNKSLSSKPLNRFSLIKNLGPNGFHDLIGQIVKISPRMDSNDAMDVYITDYTENKLMYRYPEPGEQGEEDSRDGDQYGYTPVGSKQQWPGPFGHYTLQVRLYPPHSLEVRDNYQPGDIIFLQNVKLKQGAAGFLEGNLHKDRVYEDQKNVGKAFSGDPRVGEVIKRKAEMQALRDEPYSKQKLSKADKKKMKKLKKAQAEKIKTGVAADATSNTDVVAKAAGATKNNHIRCGYQRVQISTLSDIINCPKRMTKTPSKVEYKLPFINHSWRVKVRVVDFHPPKLEDFARSTHDTTYNTTGEKPGTKAWEWAFVLLVEDASVPRAQNPKPERMVLWVTQDRAEGLLKLDATDLRQDKKTLSELREKLFILWGDLEEQERPLKAGLASNRAFECCVLEYGIENEGKWEQLRALAHTTID